MAPHQQRYASRRQRFPRPRGDGPASRVLYRYRHQVPPPTRGWPASLLIFFAARRGSPAHAGMAPLRPPRHQRRRRFPRPRGDGPHIVGGFIDFRGVPPPTRGWPPRQKHVRPQLDGSPAHAGMAPLMRPQNPALVGFPRPRGDGPLRQSGQEVTLAVPPPTRGWPLPCGVGNMGSRGSPAHAGMAPSGRGLPDTCPRFPRPRGDGPLFMRLLHQSL